MADPTVQFYLDYLEQKYAGLYTWLGDAGRSKLRALAKDYGKPTVENLDAYVKAIKDLPMFVEWTAAGKPAEAGGTMGFSKTDAMVAWLQEEIPGFWEYLNNRQQARVEAIAGNLLEGGKFDFSMLDDFVAKMRETTLFGMWVSAGSPPPPGDGGEEPPPPEPKIDEDVRDALREFLFQNELPESLMDFATTMLADGASYAEIVAKLRETPEYKSAYPENDLRRQNGFSWIPESQIRALRDQFRRLTDVYLGTDVSNTEIADLIARDVAPTEWEKRLMTYKQFERYGPVVRGVLEQELGFQITDDRLFAFMSVDIPTPELDLAYERALMRGQPAQLGLGIRPEEEADLLQQFGIDAGRAFAGYQGIASELPRTERMAAIENYINGQAEQFPAASDIFREAQIGTLFRAIQLQDPEAIARLQGLMSREVARFQAGGGPVRSGTSLVGLLSSDERRNL